MAISAREVALRNIARRGGQSPMDLIAKPDAELMMEAIDAPAIGRPQPYSDRLDRPSVYSEDEMGGIVQMDAEAGDRARLAGRPVYTEEEALIRNAPMTVDDGEGGVVQTTGARAGKRTVLGGSQVSSRMAALENLAAGSMVPTINPDSGEIESMPEAEARAAGRIVVPKGDAVSAFSTQRVEQAQNSRDAADLYAGTRLVERDPRVYPTGATTPAPSRTTSSSPVQARPSARAAIPATDLLRGEQTALEAPASTPSAEPKPGVDEDGFASAQAEGNRRRLLAGLGQAADHIGAAIAGNKPNAGFYERLSGDADLPVRDYLAAKQQKATEAKSAEEAALKDPTSAASKRFQAYVSRAFPGVYTPEDVAMMTAADAEQVTNLGQMRSTLDARRADAEASRTADATEAEKRRTFEGEQAAKNRALQRELAAARQTASGDNAEAKEQQRIFKNESDLRKELNSNPATKDFQNVAVAFDKVQRAAQDPSAAGDLSLIFGFMKMLDPGSTVREGEFANAQNAGGVGDRILASYNKVLNGERLTDAQRADFIRQARGAYDAQKASYDRVAGSYRSVAENAGVNPERVAVPVGLDLTQPTSGMPSSAGPTPTGKRKRAPDGRIWEEMSDGSARPVGGP